MTYPSDTDTIEAGIERDRASLASTIGALQDRISVEHLAQEALGLVKTNAVSYTRSIDTAVRANPLALTLTAVGVAWLIFGTKKPDDQPAVPAIDGREGESADAPPPNLPGTVRTAAAPGDSWSGDVDTLRAQANEKLRAIEADARSQARSIGGGISESLGKARDFAAERAEVLGGFAEEMKRGFRKELDDLSEAGREKIVAAREQAYAARIRAERLARDGTREASRMIADHPLIAGIVALAAGAAFAASLPRTRVEDRSFGAESDRLMEQANQLLQQERDRFGRIASGVADELKQSSRATAKAVSEEVKQASRAATATVSKQAADTAEAVTSRVGRETVSSSSTKPRVRAQQNKTKID